MTITMVMMMMMTTPVMMMMTNDATPAHIPPPTAPTHTTAALTRASSFSFSTTISEVNVPFDIFHMGGFFLADDIVGGNLCVWQR